MSRAKLLAAVTRAALALAALAAAGCAKDAGGGAAGGDAGVGGDQSRSMTPAEVAQGMQLCQGYVTRLCKCAANKPELKSDCELAGSRPEALKMAVHFLSGGEGPISTRERLEGEASARKIIAACVKADAQLDPATCPR